MDKMLGAGVCCVTSFLACVTMAWASPPFGVAATVLNRATFEPFSVKTEVVSPIDFRAKAKSDFDIVVRKHVYDDGGHTGWHKHPGPVFITVETGSLTFYELDDPTCTPIVVYAGQGYVDDGHGHIAVNQSGGTAVDISVILAPVNGAFRSELPGGQCGFN